MHSLILVLKTENDYEKTEESAQRSGFICPMSSKVLDA